MASKLVEAADDEDPMKVICNVAVTRGNPSTICQQTDSFRLGHEPTHTPNDPTTLTTHVVGSNYYMYRQTDRHLTSSGLTHNGHIDD